MDLKSFLPQVGLFRGLSEEELSKLEWLCRSDSCDAGELILKEGEKAEDICVVVEGQAELRFEIPGREATGDHTMSVVTPGKAFGWSSLVPPHELTLSVYAGEGGCRFIRMNANQLMDLFEEHTRIGFVCFKNLTRVVAKRFHAMEEEFISALGMDVMHKW
jgi:CRP-like cAMP-binding protein